MGYGSGMPYGIGRYKGNWEIYNGWEDMEIVRQSGLTANIPFFMIDSTNRPAFKTGVVVSVIIKWFERSSSSTTYTDVVGATASEIGAGLYNLVIPAVAMVAGRSFVTILSGTGADTQYLIITTEVASDLVSSQGIELATASAGYIPSDLRHDGSTWADVGSDITLTSYSGDNTKRLGLTTTYTGLTASSTRMYRVKMTVTNDSANDSISGQIKFYI